MFDRVPLYNGFSGYIAPHYYAMRTLIDEREPLILQELARQGPLGVVVDHAGDADGALRRFVAAYPGAQAVHSEAAWSSYRLPRSAGPPDLPDRTGTPLRIAALSAFRARPMPAARSTATSAVAGAADRSSSPPKRSSTSAGLHTSATS